MFADFAATMAESDFCRPFIVGYGLPPFLCGPTTTVGQSTDLPGPGGVRTNMLGFFDTVGFRPPIALAVERMQPSAQVTTSASQMLTFTVLNSPACSRPCQRLTTTLAGAAHDSGWRWWLTFSLLPDFHRLHSRQFAWHTTFASLAHEIHRTNNRILIKTQKTRNDQSGSM